MSDITDVVGKAAGILALAAFIPYVISILRRKTKPNRATWWIWTVLGLIIGISYYFSGANHTLWLPISYFVGPLAIAILSLKYGEGGWTRFDRNCLIGAGVSLVLWRMFDSPLIALIFNLSIDFMGALPTIKKSYYHPEGEDRIAWSIALAANALNLFAIERLSFAIAIYPIYMFLSNGTIAILVLFRPRGGE